MSDIKINVQVVQGQATSALNELAKASKNAEKSVDALNVTVKQTSVAAIAIGNVIGNFATKAISSFTDAVSHLITGGLELESQIENLTFKFQALIPAGESVKGFLEEIEAISNKSPFEFVELADAAKQLLVFGVESENVLSVLSNLGDIATASGSNIGELSLAFGKAAEAGVVTSRELNAFRNNGIPILQALSEELGVSTTKIKTLANQGKIDIGTFEKALQSLGKEGGFAFDAMAKKALTLEGSQKKLKDSIEELEKQFGKNLAPVIILAKNALSAIIHVVSDFLTRTNALETAVQALVFGFGVTIKAGAVLYNTFKVLLLAINEVAAVASLFGTTVISGMLTGIQSLIKGLSAVAGALGINVGALDSASSAIDGFKESIALVPATFHETAGAIANDITATSDSADKFVDGINNSFFNLTANMKQAATGTGAAAADIEKGLTEAQMAEQQKRLANEASFQQALLTEKQAGDLALLEQKLLTDGTISAQDQVILLEKQNALAADLEARQLADAQRQVNQDIAFGVELTTLQEHQNKVALLKAKADSDNIKRQVAVAKAEENARKERVSRDAEMFQSLTILASLGSDKLFKVAQAFQIANAVMAGFTAVQLAASAAPFPANVPGIIIETARAATNIAGIKSQSPRFQDGGIVPGTSFSGDQVLSRLNSGEMVLNRQQQAQLFNQANGQGSSSASSGGDIVVQIDGQEVFRAVSRQVANGSVLGEGGV